MRNQPLVKAAATLIIIVFSVLILVYAKPFLVPLTFAALLSMLLLPVSKWLEAIRTGRVVAAIVPVFIITGVFVLIIYFINWQVSDLVNDVSKIEERVLLKYNEIQKVISDKVGIPPEQQQEILKQQRASTPGKLTSIFTSFLAGLFGFATNTVLVLVYIFLFIYFRHRLKTFIIKLVPKQQTANTLDIVNSAQKVAQKYLTGLSLMIICLWIMYSIGFSIAGVRDPVFFAIVCGLLEIVPFIGNLTGTLFTVSMSLVHGGGIDLAIAIIITYATVQLLQTYILEPLVVGAQVSINPLFTIVGLMAGEILWGIPGMILAIPLLGITKIVCDHIEPLKPYGYLVGGQRSESGGLGKKLKGWFKK